MELTTKLLQKFVGGQLEVQNQREGYLYRGEIKTIEVEDGVLKAEWVWKAEGEGFPPFPKKWVVAEPADYEISIQLPAATESKDRIIMFGPIVGEIATLFPPDGSKLDPDRVEGLELVESS